MKYFTKYQQVIGEINWYAFLAFLAVLPYSHSFSRPIWMVWLISWLLECRFLVRPIAFKDPAERRKLIPFIGLAVWFLWGVVSLLWVENRAAADSALMRNFDLFFLLPVALWGVNERYNWRTCLKVMLVTCLISVFVYLFAHYWVMNYQSTWDRNIKPSYKIDWLHLENFTMNMKHRLQYVSLLCLAVPCLFLLVKNKLKSLGKVRAVIFTTLPLIVFCLATYWSKSREGVVNLIVLLSTTLVFAFPPHRRIVGVVSMLILAAALLACAVRFHPRFNEVPLREYFRISDNPYEPAPEPRCAIWYAALENPSDYSIYGKGVGQCADYMVQQYERHGWPSYVDRRFHSHNQYLCTWIEFGFAAMLLFFLLWLSVPFAFRGQARYFAVFFTEIMMLNMCTENILSGIEGIFFTAAGMLLLLVIPSSPSAALKPASSSQD